LLTDASWATSHLCELMITGQSPVLPRRQRRRAERALWRKLAHPLWAGCSSWAACRIGCARCSNRARHASLLFAWAAHATFGPVASWKIEFLLIFHFGLNSSLIFGNSYISVQSFKNHKTSSVGFINLRSIQENIKPNISS
jgi:hypothetical protein